MNDEDRVTLNAIKKRLSVYHEPMQVWSRGDIAFLIALAEKQAEFIDWMESFGQDELALTTEGEDLELDEAFEKWSNEIEDRLLNV